MLDQRTNQWVEDLVSDAEGESFLMHDATNIVDLCVHAIRFPDSQLSQDKLVEVGCQPRELETILSHLEAKCCFPKSLEEGKTKEVKLVLSTLQKCDQQEKLATLDGSKHLEYCVGKINSPFKGKSKGAKQRVRRR